MPASSSESGGDEMSLMAEVMQESLKEMREARLARLSQGNAVRPLSSEPEDARPGHVRTLEESDEGGPNNSPWGRRALGDSWYIARCIQCSACARPIMASHRGKRGVRCAGCLRWFHDRCAPKDTLPSDKAMRECSPTTSGYYHCSACSQLHQRLQQGAQALCDKELGGGCRVALIDLHSYRQKQEPGPYQPKQEQKQRSRPPRSSEPFKQIARSDLMIVKKLGSAHLSGRTGIIQDTDLGSEDVGKDEKQPVRVRLPRGGLADLTSVVKIFNTYDRNETLTDVLEDGWAAVLRCGDAETPVSAASLLVFGDDHARLQELVTVPDARRKGYARLLVSEISSWLHSCGVPRLVAVLPRKRTGTSADDKEVAFKRLQFKPLQDLNMLGAWKETFFNYYTRELIGQGPRIVVRELDQTPFWARWLPGSSSK